MFVSGLDVKLVFELVEVNVVVWRIELSVGAGGEVLRLGLLRHAALAAVVDALMVVERVERSEHLVAEAAARRVQRLQVLLLRVPLEREARGQQLAAHLAAVARAQRAHCATHNNQHQRISQQHTTLRIQHHCDRSHPTGPIVTEPIGTVVYHC